MGEVLLEVDDVTRAYGSKRRGQKQILRGVSFRLQKGKCLGLVGESGCGKSTLLRTVNGLQSVSAGSVIIDGKNVSALKNSELRELRKNIGMIFQHFNLMIMGKFFTREK